jgi:hypothetical protein
MKKRLLSIIIVFSVFALGLSIQSHPVQAKWKASSSKSPSLSASVAKNKRSTTATFTNLSNVKSISYQLTYNSNKGPQGAGGTIKVTSSRNLSRTLLFGTCSHGVCSYHTNIKDAKLSVDFTLKSGGVVSFEKTLIK